MLARAREAPPAAVLVAVAILVALAQAAISLAFAAEAWALLIAPAFAVVVALIVHTQLHAVCSTGSRSAHAGAWVLSGVLLPLAVLGVSFGGFALFPVGILCLAACAVVRPPAAVAAQQRFWTQRTLHRVCTAGLLGLLAIAVYCTAVALPHTDEAIYGVPDWGASAIAGALICVVAGTVLALYSGRGEIALTAAAAVLLTVVFLLLGMLLAFPLLAVPALLAALLFGGLWTGERRHAALAGGVLAGIGVPLLVAAALAGPLADCSEGAGPNVWTAPPSLGGMLGGVSTSSGGMSDFGDGRTRGTESGEGYVITYACTGDRLTDFSLRRR